MTRRYWAEIDGERIYRASLDAIKRIAQDTADKLGRVVRVGYEDAPAARRNPAARTEAQMAKLSDRALETAIEKASERDSALGHKLSPEHRNIVYSELRKISAPDVQAYVAAREATHDLYAHQKFRKSHGSSYVRKLYAANPAKGPQTAWAFVDPNNGRVMAYAPAAQWSNERRLKEDREFAAKWGYAMRPVYGERTPENVDMGGIQVRQVKRNPVDLDIPAYAQAKDRARRGRLGYLAATKARRLAASLRKRQPRTVRRELAAAKTGKFAVHVAGATVNGVRQPPMTLYRASRTSADALGAGFEAAGYQVTIAPV